MDQQGARERNTPRHYSWSSPPACGVAYLESDKSAVYKSEYKTEGLGECENREIDKYLGHLPRKQEHGSRIPERHEDFAFKPRTATVALTLSSNARVMLKATLPL